MGNYCGMINSQHIYQKNIGYQYLSETSLLFTISVVFLGTFSLAKAQNTAA